MVKSVNKTIFPSQIYISNDPWKFHGFQLVRIKISTFITCNLIQHRQIAANAWRMFCRSHRDCCRLLRWVYGGSWFWPKTPCPRDSPHQFSFSEMETDKECDKISQWIFEIPLEQFLKRLQHVIDADCGCIG